MTSRKAPEIAITAAVATALMTGLAGCAGQDDYARICTDENGVRVADHHCRGGGNTAAMIGTAAAWYYLSTRGMGSGRYPAIGEPAARGGTFTKPPGQSNFATVSSRGGFGKSAVTHSSSRGSIGG